MKVSTSQRKLAAVSSLLSAGWQVAGVDLDGKWEGRRLVTKGGSDAGYEKDWKTPYIY
jgi:hypothetical protein